MGHENVIKTIDKFRRVFQWQFQHGPKIQKLLIEKGIDINQKSKDGSNALHLASKKCHKEIVELLIEKGIDINQTDNDGRNALHWASFQGHSEIVKLLIAKGIDINQTN